MYGTAINISEDDMDQAIEEAQDIYKEDIMKSIRKVFEGKSKDKIR